MHLHAAPTSRRGAAFVAASVALALVAWTASAEESSGPTRQRSGYLNGGDWSMVRFEFDNDTFIGSDDAFSAGWSLQLHSGLKDRWNGPLASRLGRLPLLGDDGDGGRVVRRSFGISQQIFTPADLSVTELQPHDAPYAGLLGVHGSWASYDNRRFAAIQLYAGCVGPCSHAEDVQKFVHEDMGRGTPPKGWDNQLDTKWVGNVNFAWRRKVFAPRDEAYLSRKLANDLSIGGQLAVGNTASLADAQIEYRFGLGLPMGFTHIPDPAPRGVVLDPLYVSEQTPVAAQTGLRGYVSVVLRATAIDEVVVRDGGRTVKGERHPGFSANEDEPEVLLGLHVGRGEFAVHLTYYRYLGGRSELGPASKTDWCNLSLERRF